jgi:hypothetical protein
MKKKRVLYVVGILLLGIICLYLIFIYGYLEFRPNKDTPKEYLSHFVIKKENYLADSVAISTQFKKLISQHKDFFYSREFDDATQIIIDTILYNSNFNKLAVLVFTKNPTARQLMPDPKSNWYYDATCYLGIRQQDSISLSWFGNSFTNSIDLKELKSTVRENFFRLLATTKDSTSLYKHNLNDTRFWNGAVWKAIEDKKLSDKKFEEEKKKHPENVYEPQ